MSVQDEIRQRPQTVVIQILHEAPPMTRKKLLEVCTGLGLERSAAQKTLDTLVQMNFVREQEDGVLGLTDAVTIE